MPTLEGIREFLQVVECASFSRAADKLDLSVAQVSRLVTQLEKKLGVRLLYRSTRKLSLTEEGEFYYQKCKQSLGLLENAELEIGRKVFEPSGTLKINLSGWFQEVFMVPILIDFMNHYPRLEVSVTLTDHNVDVIQEGCDVSICAGELADSSVIAKKMASVRFAIVATRAYLDAHGTPTKLSDLDKHNCLAGYNGVWMLSTKNKMFHQPVHGNWKTDNAHAILAATMKGVGLGHLPVIGIMDLLARGELVELLKEYTHKGVPVWVVYPNRNHISAKVRFFIDYLSEAMKIDSLDAEMQRNLMGN